MYEQAKETLVNDEGYECEFYLCSKGKLSVGIGHNVDDNGIHPAVLAQLLKDGCIEIGNYLHDNKPKISALSNFRITKFSDAAVRLQFRIDFDNCVKDAEKLYGSMESYPEKIQTTILNMCFQLGYNKLKQFKKFRRAALDHDTKGMVREMKDSRYYRQVTKRADRLIRLLMFKVVQKREIFSTNSNYYRRTWTSTSIEWEVLLLKKWHPVTPHVQRFLQKSYDNRIEKKHHD